jgi:hypothetical protein
LAYFAEKPHFHLMFRRENEVADRLNSIPNKRVFEKSKYQSIILTIASHQKGHEARGNQKNLGGKANAEIFEEI